MMNDATLHAPAPRLRYSLIAAFAGVAAMLGGCVSADSQQALQRAALAAAPMAAPMKGWQSPLRATHPLVGRIWEVESERYLSADELVEALATKRFVLLGEKHDNPDHHSLQLALVDALASSGRLAGISFEMLASPITPRLKTLPTRTFESANALAAYLEWDDRGWDWELYGPLVKRVVDLRIPIAAGNISRDQMSAMYSPASDEADKSAPPRSQQPLSSDALASLRADIDTSHCGMLPESQFDAMLRVQQGRDLEMARSLMALPSASGVRVLIAGNYHTRQDIGVPNYLFAADSARAPALERGDIVNVSLLEVATGELEPAAYLETSLGQASADYLWFTPALSDKDYCASLRGEG